MADHDSFDDAAPNTPRRSNPHPPTPSPPNPEAERSRPHILIADDDPETTRSLSDYLAYLGYVPVAAAGGEAALALAATYPLDLALLDVWMPGPSGMALAARLRAIHPDLKIIIITAHASVQDVVEAMRQGAFDYLEKPLRMERIKKVVEQALAGEPALPSPAPKKINRTLSPRQLQVLRLMARGMSNRQIATELGLSEKTVGNYVSAILRALQARNRTAAVLVAQESGLL